MYSCHKYARVILAALLVLLLTAGSALALPAAVRTITAAKATGDVGTQVFVPITIDNAAGVGGIAFTIKYDPALFTFLGLEQATAGWTIQNPESFKAADPILKYPPPSNTIDALYYNPYLKEAPYADRTYTLAANSTLFYQYNDMKDGQNNPIGQVLVAGASADSLTGTTLFKANFQIKAVTSIINGTMYPIQLLRTIINNPAAGYTSDTFLPILVGTGDKVGDVYTSTVFPVIPAQLVAGGITVGGVSLYSLGGKATYGATLTGSPAAGCTVTLKKETQTPTGSTVYIFNEQTTVSAAGQYGFSGKSAGNYKIFVQSLNPGYNDYESAVIELKANKTDADAVLAAKQTIRVGGTVTAGNIAGLLVKVVDGAGKVRTYGIGTDGKWTSDLLPQGTYQWYLVYGNLTPAGPYAGGDSQTFDTSTLKAIKGTISGLSSISGVVTAVSVTGKIQKTVNLTTANYEISYLVPANDYIVSIVAPGLPVTYYNGKKDISEATKVIVASTEDTTGINFTFDTSTSKSITGWIKEDSGSGLAGVPNITVYGFEVNTFAMVQAATDGSGNFNLTVDPGTYEVFVIKRNGKIFYFYNENGTPTQSEFSAKLVTVSDTTVGSTNIDITECDLTLTGKVTKGVAAEPVSNALITAATATQRALGVTGQDGRYSVGGLCNGTTYAVEMKPLTGNYPVQTATIVAGTDTTKDFVIDTGAKLSGTVTETVTEKDSSPVKNIAGAMIYLKDQDTGTLVGGRIYFSGSDGAYTILDVKEGSYTLEVTHPDYKSYTVDLLISSSNVTQDVTLEKGAHFKGTVTEANSDPVKKLPGVTVIVSRTGAMSIYAVTNADGLYSVYGLDALQTYTLFAQKRGYERKFELNKAPSTAGTTVDFALSPPAVVYKINGAVTTKDSANNTAAVSGAVVLVSSSSKNFFAATATGTNGAYEIANLPGATDYRLVVIAGGNLPTKVVPGITVNTDPTVQDVEISLGETIGGKITGPPADAIVYVFLYKGSGELPTYTGFTRADGSGNYSFKGLTAGTDYKVLVVSAGYTSQWFSGKVTAGTADEITSGRTDVNLTLTAVQ